MGDQFEGNGALYPESYPMPDDSDPPIAAVINPALEALGHRTEFLRTHGGSAHQLVIETWDAPGGFEWTVPAGVSWIIIEMLGGGGAGGAGGVAESTSANEYPSGGGGGGAADLVRTMMPVVEGETILGDVGAGGFGGAGHGSPGSASYVGSEDGVRSRIAPPASGGRMGGRTTSSSNTFVAPGGGPAGAQRDAVTLDGHTAHQIQMHAGDGGWASTRSPNHAAPGASPREGMGAIPVSSVGTRGTDGTSSYRAGGGGGGGGSSAFGKGGNGGNGGNGNGSGAGAAATAGANALVPGAGGGGGGGGGGGSTSAGARGNGGNGGHGIVRIIYVNPVIEVP
ncbi:MAG: hypothetical protein KF764_08625 [Labilithrix sp.]|nr:hypothetical protein [Labilithrix sp.]